MMLTESLSTLDKAVIGFIAVTGLAFVIAAIVVYIARRAAANARARIERDVEAALTDPAYAPYGADLEDRDADEDAIVAQLRQLGTDLQPPAAPLTREQIAARLAEIREQQRANGETGDGWRRDRARLRQDWHKVGDDFDRALRLVRQRDGREMDGGSR